MGWICNAKAGRHSSAVSAAVVFLTKILMVANIAVISFTNADLIQDGCKYAEDPAWCAQVLGADPRARSSSNLAQLCCVAVDLALYNATGTLVKIHDLRVDEKDPAVRSCLNFCNGVYTAAQISLKQAKDSCKNGKWEDVNLAGTEAYDVGSNCERCFQEPPPTKSPLTTDNLNLKNLGDAVLSTQRGAVEHPPAQ